MILPSGKYYIGDPCYVVPDEHWGELLDDANFFVTRESGRYFDKDLGKSVIVYAGSTAWGDGLYSDGSREYPVDSGSIGIINAECIRPGKKERHSPDFVPGHYIEFDRPFTISMNGGIFKFGEDLEINTRDQLYEDEDEEFIAYVWDDDPDNPANDPEFQSPTILF